MNYSSIYVLLRKGQYLLPARFRELTKKTIDDGDTHFKCRHFRIVQETETERRTIKGGAR